MKTPRVTRPSPKKVATPARNPTPPAPDPTGDFGDRLAAGLHQGSKFAPGWLGLSVARGRRVAVHGASRSLGCRGSTEVTPRLNVAAAPSLRGGWWPGWVSGAGVFLTQLSCFGHR